MRSLAKHGFFFFVSNVFSLAERKNVRYKRFYPWWSDGRVHCVSAVNKENEDGSPNIFESAIIDR